MLQSEVRLQSSLMACTESKSRMIAKIPAEKMAAYRATARRRRQQERQQLAHRRQRACEVARQASQLLKEQFGVKRVVLFGSLRFPERFHQRSDVDLAVWGLEERLYYRAVARLLDLDPAIAVDIIEAELASSTLLATIEREGVPI